MVHIGSLRSVRIIFWNLERKCRACFDQGAESKKGPDAKPGNISKKKVDINSSDFLSSHSDLPWHLLPTHLSTNPIAQTSLKSPSQRRFASAVMKWGAMGPWGPVDPCIYDT